MSHQEELIVYQRHQVSSDENESQTCFISPAGLIFPGVCPVEHFWNVMIGRRHHIFPNRGCQLQLGPSSFTTGGN